MADEPSVVEAGSCIASQDLLKMQLTTCVLEICFRTRFHEENYPDQHGISRQVRPPVNVSCLTKTSSYL
jgi:hypothetical protein